MSKQELEIVLKAIKILKANNTNDRLSLSSIEELIKELYIKAVTEEL